MRRFQIAIAAVVLALFVHAPPAFAAWVWPLRGEILTPYRNGDDPYAAGQHRGIDIAGPVGAPVVAAAAGEVRFAGTAGSSGLTVSVRTGDGFDTSYLHLASTSVRAGESVSAGQRIGVVGTTGVRSAAAPHLHFGVRDAGVRHAYRDPLALLPPLSTPAPKVPSAAPVPGAVPVAPVVAPAPAAEPAPRQLPVGRRIPRRVPARPRVPAGRRVPGGHRVPVGRRVPAARRIPAAHPAPARRGAPVARRLPGLSPDAAGRPAPAPAREGRAPVRDRPAAAVASTLPHLGPGLKEGPALPQAARSSTEGADGRAQEARTAPERGGGLDIGWALACAGLLLAAGILSLSDDGRQATRRRGARFVAAIRPLLGKR